MTKGRRETCITCNETKGLRNFYASNNPMHSSGYIPFCRECITKALGDETDEEVQAILRTIDRPFLYDLWDRAKQGDEFSFGAYMRTLGGGSNRELTWKDSVFEEDVIEEARLKAERQAEETEEFLELEKKWGVGYPMKEMLYFDKKYNSLTEDFPPSTPMHDEAIKTYCVYKVRAETATAQGDIKNAKTWAELAQKQGDIAKINPNKLSESDLSQGLDGFGELAQRVEQAVDIIPILPRFIAQPHDEIDFALLSYVNYMRDLEGLELVEHSDVYQFYEEQLEEYAKENKDIRDQVIEVEIPTKNGKKKLKTIEWEKKVKKLQQENPNSVFYKNLDKWVVVVSFFRFYPDLFYDMIRPKTGGMRLDADQRMLMRSLARFRSNMGVFSRGYGKCVGEDTILSTGQGLVEIQDFFNIDKNNKEQEQAIEIEILNKLGVLTQTSAGLYSGFKPTKKIETREGYEIETTHKHPIKTIDKDGVFAWKKADEITTSDYIAISRADYKWEGNNSLDQENKEWNKIKKKDWTFKPKKTIDSDLSRILGYLLPTATTISDDTLIVSLSGEKAEKVFKKLEHCGLEVTIKNNTVLIKGKGFTEWLKILGVEFTQRKDRKFPRKLLKADKDLLKDFIYSIIEENGFYDVDKLHLELESNDYLKIIQIALSNMGIISSRSQELRRLTLDGKNLELFLTEFGLDNKKTKSKEESIIKDEIPYIYEEINSIIKSESSLEREESNRLKELDNDLTLATERDYFFSKVVSIENSENHVFDISVPDTNSYVANGIVNHNTFIQLMSQYHSAIWYPNLNVVMTAQTKENASSLIDEKNAEIRNFFPLLENEIVETRISKDKAVVKFSSGAKLDTLANTQGSKGARRHRITIEESAQVSAEIFQDVLEPVVNVPRKTVGEMSTVNPFELNGAITRFTTSWYKGTNEYEVSLRLKEEMVNLKGTMTFGAGWELPCKFGRGELQSQVLARKEKISPSAFAINYNSQWIGVTRGALVDIGDVMDLRTLPKAELKGKVGGEYYIGVDVARSEDETNNQCSMAIVKAIRNADDKISKIHLVNIINIPAMLNFQSQAVIVMETQKRYNAKAVVVDGNGLGIQKPMPSINSNELRNLRCA